MILAGCIWFLPATSFAGPAADIESALLLNTPKVNAAYIPALVKLYSGTGFKRIWTSQETLPNLLMLQDDVAKCGSVGLNPNEYFFNGIQTFLDKKTPLDTGTDTADFDIKVSEAAIRFYTDVRYGNKEPKLSYQGVRFKPDAIYIAGVLTAHIHDRTIYQMADMVSPVNDQICTVAGELEWIDYMMNREYFEEVEISSLKAETTNKNLLTKLHQLGLIRNLGVLNDSVVAAALQQARDKFNLTRQVRYQDELLRQLNAPLEYRYTQLCTSLNYYKRIYGFSFGQHVLVVNTASQRMQVFHKGEKILGMKMILGKKTTPTPTLSSKIKGLIFFPYWHIPQSIAGKEVIPAIRRNKDYLRTSETEVFNKSGKRVDPGSVNWHKANPPSYTFRQKNGYYNALGILKIDFYSPFGVYLHDTPGKALFLLDYRLLSHGCMRMEEPLKLARLLLSKHTGFVDSVAHTLPRDIKEPVSFLTDEDAVVIVWNNNAEVGDDYKVVFYKDAYKTFKEQP